MRKFNTLLFYSARALCLLMKTNDFSARRSWLIHRLTALKKKTPGFSLNQLERFTELFRKEATSIGGTRVTTCQFHQYKRSLLGS